jgi:hypothetical protein
MCPGCLCRRKKFDQVETWTEGIAGRGHGQDSRSLMVGERNPERINDLR